MSNMDEHVPEIVGRITDVVGVDLDAKQVMTLTANMKKAFTHSRMAKNWSWEYRIISAFPDPDLPDSILSVLTTIEVGMFVEEESPWSDRRSNAISAAVTINTMRLVVTKGFKGLSGNGEEKARACAFTDFPLCPSC